MSTRKPVEDVAALLEHSLAIEKEAAERYADLAGLMEVHNNPEIAALFWKLAEIEGKHVAKVEEMGAGHDIAERAPWDYDWRADDSPEGPRSEDGHYLMTPHHALTIALEGERRAVEFFARVAEATEDADVRELAESLRDEEIEHVGLVEAWLQRYPPPDTDWDDDPDPPVGQE